MHRRLSLKALGAASAISIQAVKRPAQCERPAPVHSEKVSVTAHDERPSTSWLSFQPLRNWWAGSGANADTKHFEAFENNPSISKTGLMSWPSMQRGLQARANDEVALLNMTKEFQEVAKANDRAAVEALQTRLADVVYGPGITRAMRNKHVEQYGCVKYTEEVLLAIAEVAQGRGVVELGAGHGQWAKQLAEAFSVDTIAFDNMASLPLRGQVKPNPDFSQNVIKGDESVLLHRPDLRGRVLLLIFPDPGSMASRCLSNYIDSSVKNDTLVYVGEGRGGANADDKFFDMLETSGEWTLERTLPLEPFGTKGFERFFIFRRCSKSQ
ncbi:hypothetical protein AC1031_003900 [Aphanomyces cochlioides]|nr:hypothetical protein AC1031_003900 [Aphanomyces cochlioides]